MGSDYPFEKLGMFYLGKEIDTQSGEVSALPFLYRNKNLTTHAAIIGMTGSGKTGLGIGIIEEAVMDNIPSIIIDPKGDMGNLLLTFPECAARDFTPWVDPADAAKKGLSVDEYAAKTAETWKNGLAEWGQGLDRIASLRGKSTFSIYTPGSTAGAAVSVLGNFAAPSQEVLADTDALNSLVNSTVTSLLALIDVTGDPMQSREHILLSSLFLHFWRKGEDLGLESLIGNIVAPPFTKIGVFSLDTFFPQPERMKLAMGLNNILASPTFAAWTQGVPLDIQRILYNEDGRPNTAIFSLSHLGDNERMFFVTMLLNAVIAWMRKQQGSSALKALLYMDEIFGYFPPTANPPSKKPMMLLLKQARAYGLGVVLSTQNPVDLDYKGLSNIGTWFIGRLQTSQDQERVLDGIVGSAGSGFDKKMVKELLTNLKGRQFLLKSAHLDEPLLFQSRWVMSYLKGPVSRADIKKLMINRSAAGQAADDTAGVKTPAISSAASELQSHPPMLSSAIEQRYHLQNLLSDNIVFEPWLAASCSLRFYNSKRNIDQVEDVSMRCYLDDSFQHPDWSAAEVPDFELAECTSSPPEKASYYSMPAVLASQRNFRALEKHFADYLYQNRQLELFRMKDTSFESTPGESMGDFRIRFSDWLREEKEAALEKLKEKFARRQETLEGRLDTALDRLDKEKVDVRTKTTDSLISFGVAIAGALFGRKGLSVSNIGRAATGARSVGRVAKERSDVRRAEEEVVEIEEKIAKLAEELTEKADKIAIQYSLDNYEIETFTIKPRRSDIFDVRVMLLWDMVV